jgi:hypothetical protein
VVNRRVPSVRAADAIAQLRAAGWSTAKLAAEVGCSTQAVRRIGRGDGRCWSTIEQQLVALVS